MGAAEVVEKFKLYLLYVRRPRVHLVVEAECPIGACQKALESAGNVPAKPVGALVQMKDKTVLAFRFKKSGPAACPASELVQFDVDEVRRSD